MGPEPIGTINPIDRMSRSAGEEGKRTRNLPWSRISTIEYGLINKNE